MVLKRPNQTLDDHDSMASAEAQTSTADTTDAAPFDIAGALAEAWRLQKAGQLDEAYELCSKVKKADKRNPDAFNLGGIIAFQGGDPALARKLLRRATKLEPKHAAAHNNLGIVYRELGELSKAEKSFHLSLELNPDDADTHYNFGNTLKDLGRYADASSAYERAAEIRPDFVEALYNRANMLAEIGRYELAIQTFRQVVTFLSDFAEAHYALGKALCCAGRYEEAIPAFEEALSFEPTHKHALDELTVASMRARGPEALVDMCEARLRDHPGDQIATAAKAIGLHELGRETEASGLIDLERFVRPYRVEAHEGYDDISSFNAALVDHILQHPTLEYEPNAHATRNGMHSGNLNRGSKGPIEQLDAAIMLSANKYISEVPAEPPHPFFETIAKKSRLVIWSVVMKTQGHQVPHIHPGAWISGVYYPKLPNVIDEDDAQKAGWIEFGRPPEQYACEREPRIMTFKPEEGLMFLFPSCFYHRTIPFDTDEQRVSIAFDLIAHD